MSIVVNCLEEYYDVFIGTGSDPVTGEPSPWATPFRIGRDGTEVECLRKYRRWVWDQLRTGQILLAELACLEDKRLGCWCAGPAARCHGDVLVPASAWAMDEVERRVNAAWGAADLSRNVRPVRLHADGEFRHRRGS